MYVTDLWIQMFSHQLCEYKTTMDPISTKTLEKLVFKASGITQITHIQGTWCYALI